MAGRYGIFEFLYIIFACFNSLFNFLTFMPGYAKRLLLGLLIIWIAFSGRASSFNLYPLRLDVAFHGGFIMAHDSQMQHLTRGHFVLNQLSVSRQTSGSHSWHNLYGHPYLGFSFLHGDLGYPEVLGRAFAFFPHIRLPMYRADSWGVYLQHGLGMGYLTRYFKRLDNYKNMAIGSPWNIALNISLEFQWSFYSAWQLNSGFSLTHFSNGRTQTPNKGINIPGFKMGVSRRLGEPRNTENAVPEPLSSGLLVTAAAGSSAGYPPGSGAYARYSFNATYHMPVSKKHRLGLGYDFFASENRIKPESNLSQKEAQHIINHGLHFSFQQQFGQVAFIIHNGLYLWDPEDFREYFFYQRAGFRYHAGNNILLNLTLKTHLFKAEFIEWGVGYKIF